MKVSILSGFLLLLSVAFAAPSISWNFPTPGDGSTVCDNWVYLNTTITDSSDTSAFFDWDDSLVGYWSFENYDSTTLFDGSTYQNDGQITFLGSTSSTADGADTNASQCVDDDTLWWNRDHYYKGWTFEVTSGAASGSSTTITDYDFIDSEHRTLYFHDELAGFTQGDSYTLYYDTGGPTPTPGRFGSAMDFDGGNDYILVEDDDSLDFGTGDFTISVWFKNRGRTSGGVENFQVMVSKTKWTGESPPGEYLWKFYLVGSGGELSFSRDGQHTILNYHGNLFGENIWRHAVVKREGNDGYLYLDGNQVDHAPGFFTGYSFSNNRNLHIGVRNDSTVLWEWFNGSIDEVRIHKRALSEEEIKASYDSAYGLCRNFTGLSEGTYGYTAWAINEAGETTTLSGEVTYDPDYVGDNEPPVISWEPPTLADGATTFENWVYLNTGISDDSDTSAFFDWDNSLVGYWSFDHYDSNGMFDNSSYNNFGSFRGTDFGQANMTSGKYGQALEFDGLDDWIEIPYHSSLDCQYVTMEAWAKPNKITGLPDDLLIISHNVSNNGSYGIWLEDTNSKWRARIYLDGIGKVSVYSDNVASVGAWTHVAATYDGDKLKMYIDGVLQADVNDTDGTIITSGGGITAISRVPVSNYEYFNGSIDEVRVYNRALSAEEISVSYGGSQLSRNFTGLSVGSYGCTVWAIDSYGNMAAASRSVLLSVVQGTPSVTLVSPDDDAGTNDTQPVFSFIVDDSDDDTVNCSLYIDDGIVETKEVVSDGSTESVFIPPVLSFGVHSWFVNCTDGVNIGVSPAWSLTVYNESSNGEDNKTEVNDTQPPPANDTNDTVPPQNGSEDQNLTSPGTEANQSEANVTTRPICGNGIKEIEEECDGEDGVPDGGYWCSEDCELMFPVQDLPFPSYYGQDVTIGWAKINLTVLLALVLGLCILSAGIFLFYYKETLKNKAVLAFRKDTLEELDEVTKREGGLEQRTKKSVDDLEKPLVPTLDDIELDEEKD